jgi:hypothetical protein
MSCPFSFNLLVKSVQILYGSISSPTDLIHEKYFSPDGYHLEDSGEVGMKASKTNIGGPSDTPFYNYQDPYGSISDLTTGTSSKVGQESYMDEWEYPAEGTSQGPQGGASGGW